ncbi:hypothetical protein ABMY26_17835 [Azospirillum sp. HJ39]|uniref:hypothetical protein n=1 Tax=Azospirillum sp. HJ39 TaxID=3159496 RepID=UPI003558117A
MASSVMPMQVQHKKINEKFYPVAPAIKDMLRLLELVEALDCPYRSRQARRRAASLHRK